MDDSHVVRCTADPHSFSRPEEARVTYTHLELNVDFIQKILTGNAILTITRINSSINEIILDIYALEIVSVTNESDRTPLSYKIGDNCILGSSLRIFLPQAVDINRFQIQIEYKTKPDIPALYWLTPAQTADETYPFLLSNNESTYARSWFPCQDTPSVKFRYTAMISVPKNYTVLMSAIRKYIYRESPVLDVFEFHQRNPVPSYAVVIAVGSLPLKRSYGERVFMYAEGNTSYFDIFPLDVIEEMLRIAERLCGPYLWERYNICVLPPSIAHFEIECPCLTFISRTILGADRFYTSKCIARNIAQSWAGNSVTCLSWQHVWLNKSFSIFISRKIICQISELNNTSDFLRQKGLRNLNKMIRNRNFNRCLVPNLTGILPHNATKYLLYEWGYNILHHLENMLGGPSEFEPFLYSYFSRFTRQSINTQNWIDYLNERFPDRMKVIYNNSPLNLWFIVTPIYDVPNRSLLEEHFFELANSWVQWNCVAYPDIPDPLQPPPSNLTVARDLCDVQKIIFIKYLHTYHTILTLKKLRYLMHFILGVNIRNAEIRYLWLLLCIKVGWDDEFMPALTFASENCSPNYIFPIFQHLCEWSATKRYITIRRYDDMRNKMLAQTWKSLQKVLCNVLLTIPRQNYYFVKNWRDFC